MLSRKSHSPVVALITIVTVFQVLPGVAVAQGSIFGAVSETGGGTPADSQVTFVGLLNNSDEEIRIEGCIGAGYQDGHWFDDFQNYLSEAPGIPYVYRFHDSSSGLGYTLEGTVPNNSFQQEDVVLASVTWPSEPSGLAGSHAGSEVHLSWNLTPDLTYHVYRRQLPSGGSFFRIDDAGGAPGLADSTFVDNGVDSSTSYEYVLIAESASGGLGPHTALITVAPSIGCCQIRGDVNHSGSEMIDISDLVYLVNFMFQSGPEPICMDEADINNDDSAVPDISDLVFMVGFMFQSGPEPSPCD